MEKEEIGGPGGGSSGTWRRIEAAELVSYRTQRKMLTTGRFAGEVRGGGSRWRFAAEIGGGGWWRTKLAVPAVAAAELGGG